MITAQQIATDFEYARTSMHLDYIMWNGEVHVTVHLTVDSAVVVISGVGEDLRVRQAKSSLRTLNNTSIDYRESKMREWVAEQLNELATSHAMGVPNSEIILLR